MESVDANQGGGWGRRGPGKNRNPQGNMQFFLQRLLTDSPLLRAALLAPKSNITEESCASTSCARETWKPQLRRHAGGHTLPGTQLQQHPDTLLKGRSLVRNCVCVSPNEPMLLHHCVADPFVLVLQIARFDCDCDLRCECEQPLKSSML